MSDRPEKWGNKIWDVNNLGDGLNSWETLKNTNTVNESVNESVAACANQKKANDADDIVKPTGKGRGIILFHDDLEPDSDFEYIKSTIYLNSLNYWIH